MAQLRLATNQVVQGGGKTNRKGGCKTCARLRRCRRRLFDRTYVAVARAMHRLDELRFLSLIDQRAPCQGNNTIKCRGCDITMTPNSVQQLLPGQQFPRPHDQLGQHREYLWLEGVLRPAFPEDAVPGIELAISAAVHQLIQALLPSSRPLIPHESLMISQGLRLA